MSDAVSEKVSQFFGPYTLRHIAKGEILIQAGDDPAGVYFIQEGQVRQYDISEHGNEVVVNVFKSGAFFPMAWAINHTPNRYFFEAATPVELRLAPAEDVVAFVRSNPEVTFDLLSRVYSGVEGMQRRMAHLMGGNSSSRALYELVIECKRFGEPRADGTCVLELHEEELARRAGLSRETVSRELGKLRDMQLVHISHKELIVPDMAKLEALLGAEL